MYNHVKRLASEADPFKLLLFSYLIKGHIHSFSFEEVAVVCSLVALSALNSYFQFKKPSKHILDSQVQAELNELKSALNAVKLERGLNRPQQKFF